MLTIKKRIPGGRLSPATAAVAAFATLAAFAALANLGCSMAPKPDAAATKTDAAVKQYPMRAEVISLDPSGKAARLKNEKIEGFMEAMTMGYPVKDPAEFNKMAVGDKITATLNVTSDSMWVSNIQKDTAKDTGAAKP